MEAMKGCHDNKGSRRLEEEQEEDCNKDLEAAKTRGVVANDVVTETELNKIRLVRAFVEKHDPSSKEEDDLMIRRFLRARDLDVEKASAMFLKYLKWRHSFVPNGSISPSQVPNEIADDKAFCQGRDKTGRPILFVFGRKHFQKKDGLDEFKRFAVYCLEKMCASMPPGEEKFVGIAELKGWGYANSDVRGYINALSILQDYYPERLGKLFILHAPYIFMKVWKIIYPFIDNKTKKKIIFVENNKLKSTLLEDIDESQLPEIYGGKLQLVPIQNS
ncbi:phosphatidylinositol transfer protein 3-like [Trifolium pratense]|uniref:phosphatidylinositol transfer protein 3-like n=1 Tax=Trifolium pratense TaxID=57577 RepID=UPI001E6936B5|nr:phosphatidylinositol transfer protein 3-like [Trifolium pratense]